MQSVFSFFLVVSQGCYDSFQLFFFFFFSLGIAKAAKHDRV